MRKIAYLLLLLLCAAFTSPAQVQQGDLLISRKDYEKLKTEITLLNQQLAFHKAKSDSLQAIHNELFDYHDRYFRNSIQRYQAQEFRIKKLERVNQELKIQLEQQKARTNDFRYAYQQSGRFRDKAQVAVAWAGLMSLTALMAMNGENPVPAYIVGGGSAIITITLILRIERRS